MAPGNKRTPFSSLLAFMNEILWAETDSIAVAQFHDGFGGGFLLGVGIIFGVIMEFGSVTGGKFDKLFVSAKPTLVPPTFFENTASKPAFVLSETSVGFCVPTGEPFIFDC